MSVREYRELLFRHLGPLEPAQWGGLIRDVIHRSMRPYDVDSVEVLPPLAFAPRAGHGEHGYAWPDVLGEMRHSYDVPGSEPIVERLYAGHGCCLEEALAQRKGDGRLWGTSQVFELTLGVEEIVQRWTGGERYFREKATLLDGLSRTFDPAAKEGFEDPRRRLTDLAGYLRE